MSLRKRSSPATFPAANVATAAGWTGLFSLPPLPKGTLPSHPRVPVTPRWRPRITSLREDNRTHRKKHAQAPWAKHKRSTGQKVCAVGEDGICVGVGASGERRGSSAGAVGRGDGVWERRGGEREGRERSRGSRGWQNSGRAGGHEGDHHFEVDNTLTFSATSGRALSFLRYLHCCLAVKVRLRLASE